MEGSFIFTLKEKSTPTQWVAYTRLKMKFAVYVCITISLIAAVAAVTTTAYTDAACKNKAESTSDVPNPFVQKLNACVKFSDGYSKATSCGGGKVKAALYGDAACTSANPQVLEYDTDKCVSESGQSIFITCSPASYVAVKFLAVSTAVLALCV